jgi:hypothetical protein
VDDLVDTLRNLQAASRGKAEVKLEQVGRDRVNAVGVSGSASPEQATQDRADALSRGRVIGGPDRNDDPAVAALEVAAEHLHPDEAGGACQQ